MDFANIFGIHLKRLDPLHKFVCAIVNVEYRQNSRLVLLNTVFHKLAIFETFEMSRNYLFYKNASVLNLLGSKHFILVLVFGVLLKLGPFLFCYFLDITDEQLSGE